MLGRLFLLILFGFVVPAWAAVPANDSFTNRVVLTGGRVSVTANNAEATVEANEPVNSTSESRTLWWTWTAPASGWVRTSVQASLRTQLIFWKGEVLTNLVRLGAMTQSSDLRSVVWPVRWPPPSPGQYVHAGDTFQICVAGYSGGAVQWALDLSTLEVVAPPTNVVSPAQVPLSIGLSAPLPNVEGRLGGAAFTVGTTNHWWGPFPVGSGNVWTVYSTGEVLSAVFSNLPPNDYTVFAQVTNEAGRQLITPPVPFKLKAPNDAFARATEITTLPFQTDISLYNSTEEGGEPRLPNQVADGSVWWHWAAPEDGEAHIYSVEAIGVYTGVNLGALTAVAAGQGELTFNAAAGASYYIKLAPRFTNSVTAPAKAQPFVLALRPPNDNFANRQVINGGRVEVIADTFAATLEANEVVSSNSETKTLWWTWTAPVSGWVRSQVEASFSSSLTFWKGDSLSTLTKILTVAQRATNAPTFPVFYPLHWAPPAPGDLWVEAGETYQISLATAQGGAFRWNFNLSTLRVVAPGESDSLLAQTPLTFQLSAPIADVEGLLRGTTFVVVTTNTPADPYQLAGTPKTWMVSAPTNQVSAVFQNLLPNDYFVYAIATNQDGRQLITPANRFKLRAPNDDFASASEIVTLPLRTNVLFFNSTEEAGEPVLSNQVARASLWWRWVAPAKGEVHIESFEAAAVFTGDSLSSLTPVASGYGKIAFSAQAGVSYYIKLAPRSTYLITGVPAYSYVEVAMKPGNDDFEARQPLAGGSLTMTGNNIGATLQPGETRTNVSLQKTIWWSWTAPTNGLVSLQMLQFGSGITVAVWKGDALSNLTMVAAREFSSVASPPWSFPSPFPSTTQKPPLQFEAEAGETYHLSFGSSASGPFTFSLDLCSIHVIAPQLGTNLKGPTNLLVQLSAPRPDIEGRMRALTVHVVGTNRSTFFDSSFSFYQTDVSLEGPTVAVFTNLPPNNYILYIQGTNSAGRQITSVAHFLPIQAINDHFTNATTIPGIGLPQPFWLTGASGEAGEPFLPGQSDARSIWFRWKAPATETLLISGGGPDLGVYTGSRVDQLLPVPSIFADGVLRFRPWRGTTYYIKAAPSFVSAKGTLTLLRLPVNDDFVNRIALSGTEFTLTVSNVASSVELGEPTHDMPGSLWWTWTAPATGVLQIREMRAPGDWDYGTVEVFKGKSVTELVTKPAFEEPALPGGATYRVSAGESLQLVLRAGLYQSYTRFQFRFFATPPKDQLQRVMVDSNRISFFVMGAPGVPSVLESSTDLVNWSYFASVIPTDANAVFFGPYQTGNGTRFFRLRRD